MYAADETFNQSTGPTKKQKQKDMILNQKIVNISILILDKVDI